MTDRPTWTRIKPGHHQTFGRKQDTGSVYRIDIATVDGDWHLEINGIFRGRFTTARAAKDRAEHLINTNDFSLNNIGGTP
jgi:hypothetical protein